MDAGYTSNPQHGGVARALNPSLADLPGLVTAPEYGAQQQQRHYCWCLSPVRSLAGDRHQSWRGLPLVLLRCLLLEPRRRSDAQHAHGALLGDRSCLMMFLSPFGICACFVCLQAGSPMQKTQHVLCCLS